MVGQPSASPAQAGVFFLQPLQVPDFKIPGERRWCCLCGFPELLPGFKLGTGNLELKTMKLIIAIIQPGRLEAVKEALTEVEVFRLTVVDCQGFGRQKGQTELYRGHEYKVNLLRKVQLQIAVNDDFVEPTIAAIVKGGRTGEAGQIGDGKIFVLPMDDCVRIRTGERGREAI
jgi:nitrogen regulatory protein P-II 1